MFAAEGVSRCCLVYQYPPLSSRRVWLLDKQFSSQSAWITPVCCFWRFYCSSLCTVSLFFCSCLKTISKVAFSILIRIQLGLFLFTLPGAHRDAEAVGWYLSLVLAIMSSNGPLSQSPHLPLLGSYYTYGRQLGISPETSQTVPLYVLSFSPVWDLKFTHGPLLAASGLWEPQGILFLHLQFSFLAFPFGCSVYFLSFHDILHLFMYLFNCSLQHMPPS